MKWIKRIFIWSIISLSLQVLGLYYINNYYLSYDKEVTVTKNTKSIKEPNKKNIQIPISDKVKNIMVSYNAKYVSYYEDDKLKIVNTQDGKISELNLENKATLYFYKLLPDRERILFIEKKNNDKSCQLSLYSYDLAKQIKDKVKDLDFLDEDSTVEDIQTSILTGVNYIKVSYKDERSYIYRLDRMNNMSKVSTIPKFIDKLNIMRGEDNLVYEGKIYNNIYYTKGDKQIKIKGVERLALLGSDKTDKIYLGELDGEKVKKVYFGSINEKTDLWKYYTLQTPAKRNNVYVSKEGNIYINDELKGMIKEIKSGKETSYKGKLIQFHNNGIVIFSEDKISFVKFK